MSKPYRRHFLPPSEEPLGTDWYTISVPAGAEWQQLVSGALLELSYQHRWEPKEGRVSPDKAAELGLKTLMGWIDAIPIQLTGMIFPCFTASIPRGTLLCDGATVLREAYPRLWDVYHPWYKTETTLTLPNLSNRFLMGVLEHDQVGAQLFEEYRHIGIEHLPAHAHDFSHEHFGHEHAPLPIPVVAPGQFPVASEAIPAPIMFLGSTGIVGGGQALDIRPPALTIRFVIVAV